MTASRWLVGAGVVVLGLWGAGVFVESGASQVAPPNGNLVAVAAMPVPTLAPLQPLRLPKRDMFAADTPAEAPEYPMNPGGGKGIGSVVVPDVGGASAGAPALTLLATGVDLDTNAGYALIEDNEGGRIVHVGDVLKAGGVTVLKIHPRIIELSDGTALAMATPSSTGGSGSGAPPVAPFAAGARGVGGGYFGPTPAEPSVPAAAAPTAVPGIPLNGSVNSITVNPGLNVGTNPGGFSSASGIPSGTVPGPLSGAAAMALPGGSTTGLSTGNAYQGMDPFGAPTANATPGTVNPGAVR